jgi:DNA (cytosine-5)-methyltransferase 1
MMTVGSLFAGIGGLDLGFKRAGFEVIWQCEQDDFCTKILNKHWPDTPVYDDVRKLYTDDGPNPERPDILCGGFPCKDISLAGKGAGLDGERSGLWWQYHRIIGAVRPRYAVVENVPALVGRGLPAILGALSEIGYDAEWEIVSAAALGAPHVRERLFIVAYPNGSGCGAKQRGISWGEPDAVGQREMLADADSAGREELDVTAQPAGPGHPTGRDDPADVADAKRERCDKRPGLRESESRGSRRRRFDDSDLQSGGTYWTTQPRVRPLADGAPNRVARIRGYGNAVVPQVAEYVARLVMRHAL